MTFPRHGLGPDGRLLNDRLREISRETTGPFLPPGRGEGRCGVETRAQRSDLAVPQAFDPPPTLPLPGGGRRGHLDVDAVDAECVGDYISPAWRRAGWPAAQ